jgi:hypothetical protein
VAALAGKIAETAPIGLVETVPLDLVARLWILELRRQAIIEVGGTSWPKDIWRCVRRGIESEAISEHDIAPGLSAAEAWVVRRRAKDLVARYAAAEFLEVT